MTEEKHFKAKVRAIAARTREPFAKVRAREEKKTLEREARAPANQRPVTRKLLLKRYNKIVADLLPDDIRWVFRDRDYTEVLAAGLARTLDVDALAGEVEWAEDWLGSEYRAEALARSMCEQFDCGVHHHDVLANQHFSNPTMHKAGLRQIYVRFRYPVIQACLSGVGRCGGGALYESAEIEPLVRHIRNRLGSQFVELCELDEDLADYLCSRGWRYSYMGVKNADGKREWLSVWRPGIELTGRQPTATERDAWAAWRDRYLETDRDGREVSVADEAFGYLWKVPQGGAIARTRTA